MQCAHCATPVPDDARYCQSCGSLVSDAEGQARASASIDASALQHMERLLKEDTAGHFEIQRLLGRGGMAMVYLAIETSLSRKVAIKVLPPELTFGHGVERFKREAKTAAALDHPHIIPVYRVASGGKLFWYAMKYLEGRSLEDLLKERQRLPLDETIQILSQVADALDYAHEQKVVHRDIKPANIMLDSRNRVVVTDFGIAKALTEGTLTASGSVIGTPFFMSPEQGMGKVVSGLSDQYSVGVMAYRMLSGHVPFDGDSAIDILHKHCMMPAPPLDVIAAGLPAHVGWAVNKSLEKEPGRRFTSVKAMVEALRHPTAEAQMSGAVTVMAAPPQRTRSPAPTPVTGPVKSTTRPTPRQMQTEIMNTGGSAAAEAPKGKGKLIGIAAGGIAVAAAIVVWISGPGKTRTPPETASADSVAAAPTTAVPQAPPAAAAPARITVTGLPRGGSVTVDGRAQPAEGFDLADGQHQVVMQAPGFESASVSVTATAGRAQRIAFSGQPLPQPTRVAQRPPQQAAPVQPTRVPVATAPAAASPAGPGAKGILQVRVNPWANISVDGVDFPAKTGIVDTLLAGAHSVRFEREGFITVDTVITLKAGDQTRLNVRLTPKGDE